MKLDNYQKKLHIGIPSQVAEGQKVLEISRKSWNYSGVLSFRADEYDNVISKTKE